MAPNYTNLIGARFGKLLVVAFSRFGAGGKVRVWSCLCDCGQIAEGWTQKLTNGSKTSCGCSNPRQYARRRGRPALTAERLRDVLSYDKSSGTFIWRVALGGRGRIGERAGTFNSHGYRVIAIDGRLYIASRLACLYVNGVMPIGVVDHKSTDTSDDSWDNLRIATFSENARNSRPKSKKPGHLKGAYRENGKTRWFSSIRVDGRIKHLGSFDTRLEAHEAYVAAAREYYGEFARAA